MWGSAGPGDIRLKPPEGALLYSSPDLLQNMQNAMTQWCGNHQQVRNMLIRDECAEDVWAAVLMVWRTVFGEFLFLPDPDVFVPDMRPGIPGSEDAGTVNGLLWAQSKWVSACGLGGGGWGVLD